MLFCKLGTIQSCYMDPWKEGFHLNQPLRSRARNVGLVTGTAVIFFCEAVFVCFSSLGLSAGGFVPGAPVMGRKPTSPQLLPVRI